MISSTGEVTTIAGMARTRGTVDDFRTAARFDSPTGIAVDSRGNVYVADRFNQAIHKIAPSGDVTTFAGVTGTGGSADGIGSNARFQAPLASPSIDGGTLFVTDAGGQTIRKVTPSREVSTLAGLFGSRGNVDGTGMNARFNSPSGIGIDASGRLLVADSSNHAIRVGVLFVQQPRKRAVRIAH